MADALLLEQFAVGTVTHNHQRLGQPLAHLHAPLPVLVHDLDGHAHVDELGSQIIAQLAGTHDHHRGRPAPEHPQMPEKELQLMGRGSEVDLVPRLQHEIARGNVRLLPAGHGADQHPDPDIAVQVGKAHPVEGGIFRQSVLHQLQPSLGKRLQLHGRREPQHPGNLPGGGLFRVDGHGKAQFLPHEAQLLFIFRVADAGNRVGNAQLLGHQTRQDIDLVAGGRGNEQVRLVGLRLFLDVVAGAVSAHPHHIININDVVHQLGILVNDGDLVLPGQVLGQRQSHFSHTYNDDFHTMLPRRFSWRRLHRRRIFFIKGNIADIWEKGNLFSRRLAESPAFYHFIYIRRPQTGLFTKIFHSFCQNST